MARVVVFFDLDKTVLATSASLALTKPLVASGMLSRIDVLRGIQVQLAYHLLDASHERSERVRESLSQMVTGWNVAQFEQVVRDALDSAIEPVVFSEALDAISAHHAAGHDVIISSASAEAVVRPIAHMLGADGIIATGLAEEDGHYTGQITHYNYGPEKAVAARDLAARHGWDLAESWAYSDSITDEPLLRVVGHPVAVNPDRPLARIAAEEGWQVATYQRPVQLRRSVEVPVSVAAGIGALAAVALWAWRRRVL